MVTTGHQAPSQGRLLTKIDLHCTYPIINTYNGKFPPGQPNLPQPTPRHRQNHDTHINWPF